MALARLPQRWFLSRCLRDANADARYGVMSWLPGQSCCTDRTAEKHTWIGQPRIVYETLQAPIWDRSDRTVRHISICAQIQAVDDAHAVSVSSKPWIMYMQGWRTHVRTVGTSCAFIALIQWTRCRMFGLGWTNRCVILVPCIFLTGKEFSASVHPHQSCCIVKQST
jgi:hypothetical protein